MWPELGHIPGQLHQQLEADCRYASYLRRQRVDIDALKRDEAIKIPANLDFSTIGGLSAEAWTCSHATVQSLLRPIIRDDAGSCSGGAKAKAILCNNIYQG